MQIGMVGGRDKGVQVGPVETFLRNLAEDQDFYNAWIADPQGVGAANGLSPAQVAVLLEGYKAAIDRELELEGSTARYFPRGQVIKTT
jgi:hypothetical protein